MIDINRVNIGGHFIISSSHIISPLLIGSTSLEAVFGSHVGKKDEENSAAVADVVVVVVAIVAAVAAAVLR